MKENGTDRDLVHKAAEGIEAGLAQLQTILVDRCQRRHGALGRRQIIEADHGQLFRNTDLQFSASLHKGNSYLVIAAKDRCGTCFQNGWETFIDQPRDWIADPDQGRIEGKTCRSQGGLIKKVALL